MTQVRHLMEEGNISVETMPINPPKVCRYYSFHQMIIPTVVKE